MCYVNRNVSVNLFKGKHIVTASTVHPAVLD